MLAIVASICTRILCLLLVVTAAKAAQDDWFTYRHDSARTGAQPIASDLSDPVKISGLHVIAQFPPEGSPAVAGGFAASPIVVDGTAFIGDVNGYFYALDAASGALKWQYPKAGAPPLRGSCGGPGNFSFGQYGIRTGATFAVIGGQPAVIFGAPDPDPETDGGLGSARLFALDFLGNPIWKYDGVHAGSAVVAHLTGCTPCIDRDPHPNPNTTCRGGPAYTEKHERIAYSSPLVLGDRVYVGIHDSGDSPIQQGHVVAVDLNTGHLTRFQFLGTGSSPGDGTRGGSVWNALATDGTGVFFTTGNTYDPWCLFPYTNCSDEPEPQPNNGLSMIRVDKDTGNIVWKYQPVPFAMDGDPDWAAGATVMSTSCGELIASVQKDGWSYAIDANQPNQRPSCPLTGHGWQFPPTTSGCAFTDRNQQHGDDDYRRPGAAWNDVFIVRTGGEANANITACQCEDGNCAHGKTACRGYSELHALNACAASEQDRVRWIAEIPNINPDGHVSYSSSTVTGGIVFIGTNQDPTDNLGHVGHLVVLADPSVVGASQQVCSNVDFPLAACTAPFAPVWSLQALKSVPMRDGGSLASMRNEPVLAEGRVFVATNPTAAFPNAGHVYILVAGSSPTPPGPPSPDPEATTLVPEEILAPDSVPTIIDSVTTIIE